MELKDELREQKLKYTDLEQKYKSLKDTAHKEKGKAKESILNENDELITLYACRFGVMNEMFVPKDLFLQARPQDVWSDDANRWDNDENTKNCVIAELYEETPNSLHGMLEKTSSFHDTVCQISSSFLMHSLLNLGLTSSPAVF